MNKNIIYILIGISLILVMSISFGLCSPKQDKLDLSNANSNIDYAVTCDIVSNPTKYDGKELTIKGYLQKTGTDTQILVKDANQCCSQAILVETDIAPSDEQITITGTLKMKSGSIYLTDISKI